MPPLPIQHKIAAILSAYDDLIEVNTRRIAILEEMARGCIAKGYDNVHLHSLCVPAAMQRRCKCLPDLPNPLATSAALMIR